MKKKTGVLMKFMTFFLLNDDDDEYIEWHYHHLSKRKLVLLAF